MFKFDKFIQLLRKARRYTPKGWLETEDPLTIFMEYHETINIVIERLILLKMKVRRC